MPTFELETPDGRRFEIEAASAADAMRALEHGAPQAGIGFGRAAAQGALIDAPRMLGGLADLVSRVDLENPFASAAEPTRFGEAGQRFGERLIGPRRQGTAGEERVSDLVSGGLIAAPFSLGGPLTMAAGLGGGALGQLAQGEATRRGFGTLPSAGIGAGVNIAAALAARNLPRAAQGLEGILARRGGAAAEVVEEGAEALRPPAVSVEDATQGWVKETLEDGSTVLREPTEQAANVTAKTIPSEVRLLPEDRAGNINLRLLDTPEGVKEMLRDVAGLYKGFMGARRGVVSHAETEKLATDLGWSAEQFTTARRGGALTAHELEAGRRILLSTGSALDDARTVLDADPNVQNIAAFQEAFTRHVAVQETLAGFTAETGRALNILGKMAGLQSQVARTRKMIQQAGGIDRTLAIAKMMGQMPTSGQANAFARGAIKATTFEKIVEAWKAGLLSGPQTHTVNFISNAATQGLTFAEDVASAGGRALSGDKAALAGIAGRVYGGKVGLVDGLRNAYHALKTEDAMAQARAVETSAPMIARAGAIGGRLGRTIRMPFRLLTASDQLFRTTATQSKLHQLAYEQAYRGGARGARLGEAAKEIASDPKLMEQADQFGAYSVFQKELGDVGRKMQSAIQAHPSLQLVVPFFRTPTNIFKFALERMPTAPIFKEVREAVRQGGEARADALGRIGMGSSIVGGIALGALEGNITGSGPTNPAERAAWLEENQPYSMKLGDQWVSYARIEPLASLFGIAADSVALAKNMTPKEREEVAAQLVLIAAHNLTNKTYVKGAASALLGIFMPERYAGVWVEDMAGTVVPNILTQTARTEDPTLRDTQRILDNVMNRIPGLRETLPAKINSITGEAIRLEGGVGPDVLSPLYQKTPANDPVSTAMVKLRMGINKPDRMMDGTELSPQEYETLSKRAGELGYQQAIRVVSAPYWSHMRDEEDQRDALRRVYDRARSRARDELRRQRRRENRR